MVTAKVQGTMIRIDDVERTECEIWSRVMGYYRPTSSYNIGKKQEFLERADYGPAEKHI